MAKKRLLIIGNSYMDFTAKVKRAPERAESVVSNLEHYVYPGGFGVISAVTASKLNSDVVLCTRLGDDENGNKISQCLSENSVDMRFVVTDRRKPTGVNSITAEDGGKLRTIIFPGANNSLIFDDVESSFTSYPDALLLNFDINSGLLTDTIKFANSSNVPIILNCGAEYNGFDFSNIGPIDVFSPNREQAYRITGIDPIDANSALHACIKLVSTVKCKYVVIKLGERGTFVFDGVYSRIIPMHAVDRVDENGSEIIFIAALATALLEFEDINKAALIANAASSFSVSKDGVFSSIPTSEDLKYIYDNR